MTSSVRTADLMKRIKVRPLHSEDFEVIAMNKSLSVEASSVSINSISPYKSCQEELEFCEVPS